VVFISARFLSLLLTALAVGVVLSHVMSRAGKITLPGPLFIPVQNAPYGSWGKQLVAVETGAFLSTLMVAVVSRGMGPIFYLSLVGLFCLVGMMLVWVIFINPINVRVRASSPESVPSDWALLRDRWHRLHAVRAIFAIMGFSTLVLALLLDCSE